MNYPSLLKQKLAWWTVTGWWFQPTPLKNDGVRQLGSWNSQFMDKPTIVYYIYRYHLRLLEKTHTAQPSARPEMLVSSQNGLTSQKRPPHGIDFLMILCKEKPHLVISSICGFSSNSWCNNGYMVDATKTSLL
jgi:hypothetical protein